MIIDMSHYVYKYVYNNEIIYIGKSDTSLIKRLNQHGKNGDNIDSKYWDKINNSDIYYCYANNRTMSDVIESELIRRYKPICNKAKKSDWSGIEFVEPKWIYFDKNIVKEIKEQKISNKEKGQDLFLKEWSMKQKLINERNKFDRKIMEMEREFKAEIKSLKVYKEMYDERKKRVEIFCSQKDIWGKVYDVESVYKDYLTYNDIIYIYRSTDKDINYISTAFDEKQKLICKKIIYTNEYGELMYEFQNSYKNRKNGDVIFKKGIIQGSRGNARYFSNEIYKTLRHWDRIGNAFYREMKLEEMQNINNKRRY